MAAPYRSAQKLRRDNALSEITSNATLKAAALANLGLTDVAGSNVAIASGKTFSVSNTMTLAGTDGRTYTFPTTSATIARTDAANTFTGVQTMTSPAITTPVITGSVTGTYTLAGTPTLTSPTINTPLIKDLTEVVTATNVIAAAETGSVFFLNSATEFVSTLPAVAAGLHFTFIVTAAPSGASYTVVCNAAATLIKGRVLTNDVNSATDSDFGTSGEGTLTFVDGKSVAGDTAEFWCDGTNWFVVATASVFDAITIS